jgi:hypothetical protein
MKIEDVVGSRKDDPIDVSLVVANDLLGWVLRGPDLPEDDLDLIGSARQQEFVQTHHRERATVRVQEAGVEEAIHDDPRPELRQEDFGQRMTGRKGEQAGAREGPIKRIRKNSPRV